MKLLVTGGAGFIGSAVVRRAIAQGHAVVNLDALTYAACEENVASVAGSPLYAFEKADIRDRASLDRVFAAHAPDAVMHLAAESHVDRSIDAPGDFIETNITGTFNMLEAARKYWVAQGRPDTFRFHHISTDEVFGSLPADPQVKFTEDTPYDPRSPYSASKAASDHLVRAWHETYGLPVVLTNCSNNYGPYHFPEKLIPVIILNAVAGKPLPIYGDGSNVRDWLFVEDHAEALLAVIAKGQVGRSYNIGGENERTNLELVQTICGILDRLRPVNHPYAEQITFVADRPGHDARYAIDPTRIREELGWRPSVTVEEGLERTVQWYLDNEAWWRPLLARKGVGTRLGRDGMTVLVFGKTGQVATELARLAPGARFLGRDAADSSDPAACAAAIAEAAPSAVINAAAWTAVDRAEEEEEAAARVNGAAPGAMAQACAGLGIPFVHISTDYVFGGQGTRPWSPGDATGPLGAYGRTKLAGEEAVRAAGGTHAILRTSWVFSAHGANFVRTMLRLSETRDALKVVDDQIGGPTPADAIAAACLAIAARLAGDPGLGGTYHFGGTPEVSWKDFACEIFARAGRQVMVTGIPTAEYPTPAVRPLNSRLDCSALEAAFGIPRPDWHEGLDRVLAELGAAPGTPSGAASGGAPSGTVPGSAPSGATD